MDIGLDDPTEVVDGADEIGLDSRYRLSKAVSLRPEPFGALAYHFGNRRLSFLRHPDIVAVVERLADYPTLRDTLIGCGVAPQRWPAFVKALNTLLASDMLTPVGPDAPT